MFNRLAEDWCYLLQKYDVMLWLMAQAMYCVTGKQKRITRKQYAGSCVFYWVPYENLLHWWKWRYVLSDFFCVTTVDWTKFWNLNTVHTFETYSSETDLCTINPAKVTSRIARSFKFFNFKLCNNFFYIEAMHDKWNIPTWCHALAKTGNIAKEWTKRD